MSVKSGKRHSLILLTAYIYLTGLFILLFFSGDRLVKTNYRRFYNVRPLVKIFHYNWANPRFKWLYYLEILSNIIVFIPFAAALVIVTKKISKTAVYTIVLFAPVLVEATQYAFAVGVFDIDDIILNVTGGIAGALLYYRFKRTLPIR